jgi:prephenate dehydrogenase
MDFKKVAIVGVGLMGGSFALSIRKLKFDCEITGIGRKKENLIRAKELRIIDKYSTVPKEGVKDADLILLSTPVGQFQKIVEEIREYIKKGAIVTDVGSVKAEVVKKLEDLMPEGASFVGAHPIAGRECSGVDAASSEIFNSTRCIITPSPNTDKKALKKIVKLWNAFGSKTILMSPKEHDSIFAAVSHLPHVIAYVLINTIMDLNKNILPHGGRGLRDMTRIALSPPEMWRDICSYNRGNILKSLDQFITSITHVKRLIEKSEWKNLEKEFQKAKGGRARLDSEKAFPFAPANRPRR